MNDWLFQVICRSITATMMIAALAGAGCSQTAPSSPTTSSAATTNTPKQTKSDSQATIEKYMDGFRRGDHEAILSCLTDDVEWDIPGAVHRHGKADFDQEIENDAFVGKPRITITRVIEDRQIVVAEGAVECERKEGGMLHARFCDVFEMQGAKIRKLTSYLMPLSQ